MADIQTEQLEKELEKRAIVLKIAKDFKRYPDFLSQTIEGQIKVVTWELNRIASLGQYGPLRHASDITDIPESIITDCIEEAIAEHEKELEGTDIKTKLEF